MKSKDSDQSSGKQILVLTLKLSSFNIAHNILRHFSLQGMAHLCLCLSKKMSTINIPKIGMPKIV